MAHVVPDNVGGWYHNAAASGAKTKKDRSPFCVKKSGKGRIIDQPFNTFAQSVVLTPGERDWRNFSVTTEITVKGVLPAGVAVRYKTNRDFYAVIFEGGEVKLVRQLEGTWTVLDNAVFKPPRKPLKLELRVDGIDINARVEKMRLSCTDGCHVSGGIGLIASGPASFGAVVVKTSKSEAARVSRESNRTQAVLVRKQKNWPGPVGFPGNSLPAFGTFFKDFLIFCFS